MVAVQDEEPPDWRSTVGAPGVASARTSPAEPPNPAADAAFTAFYRQDTRALVGFLLQLGARVDDAIEVAQDTMLEARQRWGSIENPRAWVRTVASRAYGRRMAATVEYPTEELPEPVPLRRADADLVAWERRQDFLTAVRALSFRQRQVVSWAFDGFTPAEIAAELKMTSQAVRASLYQARKALLGILGPTWKGEQ
ncbi:MAG TPA: sigma-70 family RNA polymerase sigma factor [Rugosimonospora sp.]|nr:sigma-70 family RNA polymerase sigma factor [Rugosimonospora sp.]